jgi:hypothetical protein
VARLYAVRREFLRDLSEPSGEQPSGIIILDLGRRRVYLDHSDALSRRTLLDTTQTVAPDLVGRPAKPHAAVRAMHCSTT